MHTSGVLFPLAVSNIELYMYYNLCWGGVKVCHTSETVSPPLVDSLYPLHKLNLCSDTNKPLGTPERTGIYHSTPLRLHIISQITTQVTQH